MHTHSRTFVFFSCRIFSSFRGTIHPSVRTPCVADGGRTSTGWWAPVRETLRFPTPPSVTACLVVPVSHRSTTLLCLGEVWDAGRPHRVRMTVFSWPSMLRVGVWDMWEASNLKHIETLRTFGSLGALKIIEHFCTRIRNIFPGSYPLPVWRGWRFGYRV